MRDRAKADGKTLSTVDTTFNGTRCITQGPTTPEQAAFLSWAAVAVSQLPESDLILLRKNMRTKLKKAKEAKEAAK